ncbi:MAG: TIGR01777 family oxidoreductase [Gemmataceae bacterium]|nr:TIGR01777 family oxidoreductase [Gemmataceae bacterium]
MRVFVTGGTGLVGGRLVKKLLERGDQPVVLTRRADVAKEMWGSDVAVVSGDPMQAGTWSESIRECDAVINLVGEGVFNRRWKSWFKQMLVDSRVRSTANVAAALAKEPRNAGGAAKVLVSASAIGIYGSTGDQELTEASPAGDDFLAKLCIDWEKATQPVQQAGVRTVIVRVGVVLDRNGGALKKMLTPFKMFVGGTIGSGKQYVSWIHHADMVGLLLFALDNAQAAGPLNGTAPNPVNNKQFAKALGRAVHRPSFFWTPGFMLRMALGQAANIITTGQRVLPKKALDLGYSFKFPEIDGALKDIFSD